MALAKKHSRREVALNDSALYGDDVVEAPYYVTLYNEIQNKASDVWNDAKMHPYILIVVDYRMTKKTRANESESPKTTTIYKWFARQIDEGFVKEMLKASEPAGLPHKEMKSLQYIENDWLSRGAFLCKKQVAVHTFTVTCNK